MTEADPDLRVLVDPTTGRPILMAPIRQQRPMLAGRSGTGPCPFCAGNEAAASGLTFGWARASTRLTMSSAAAPSQSRLSTSHR